MKYTTLQLKNAAIERVKAGRGKLSGLMWFLERRFPRQYARADIQLSLATGSTTNNTLVISAEAAAKLTERSKATLSDLEAIIAAKSPGEASDSE